MAALQELIAKIENPELRAQIQEAADKALKHKQFGLVFEEHLPECTPLYDVPVRKGKRVSLKTGKVSETYKVLEIQGDKAICLPKDSNEAVEIPVDNLVVTAKFGEPIYPYLKPLDEVCNAPESELWHTLIEADNYHALQLLEYLYGGKVDCIYIDPPYNTGAKDWKYNNDYVDGNDEYRHSKWLSFIKKRLEIAKRLLNPSNGVLILTIDEHEVHHVRCLLEEIFKGFYIQMVTCVTNPTGATQGRFSRIEEYVIYCFASNAYVCSFDDPMIGQNVSTQEVRWKSLLRSGTSAMREDRKNMFYPVYIDTQKGIVVKAGKSLPYEEKPSFEPVNGYQVAWPIRTDNSYGRWSVGAETLNTLIEKGYVMLGNYDKKRKTYGITYISAETQRMIECGEVIVTGRNEQTGVVKIEYAQEHSQAVRTVWYRTRHNAGVYGTNMLSEILGKKRKFPFPKSVYSTKDSIGTVMRDRPNAVIVDFFAGSGTTLHAVNLLNTEDNGKRRCIMVTNNEVSDDEAKALTKKRLKPGDEEWNNLGIARYITWPRTICSITGRDIKGNALKGDYGVQVEEYIEDESEVFTAEGKKISQKRYKKVKTETMPELAKIQKSAGFKANAAFFKLGFLDKTKVSLGMQFKELLSTLWMKAGAIGRCPVIDNCVPDMLILPENKMAILNDENQFGVFAEKLAEHPEIDVVYLVTDYEGSYVAMSRELPGKTTYQLYRDYLDNFRINAGRNSR